MWRWAKSWIAKARNFLFPGTCDFCSRRSLGVYSHSGAPISYSVCKDHSFLLGCCPDTIYRANTWKHLGFNYTHAQHVRYKMQEQQDIIEANRRYDEAVKELNPGPVIHISTNSTIAARHGSHL